MRDANKSPVVGSQNHALEMAQICWVVPDIHATVDLLSNLLGIKFPKPELVRAQDLRMTYYGTVVPADWLTTQAYNGVFIELVQPMSGQSMFHDYLANYPLGGVQHNAFRLPVAGFEQIVNKLLHEGFEIISEVDHPIARMTFFDTYKQLGVVTEIMGITPEGWEVVQRMQEGTG